MATAVITIRVIPRAGRTAVAGKRGDAVLVRLAAPPVDGAANDALIAFVARTARLLRGGTSRSCRARSAATSGSASTDSHRRATCGSPRSTTRFVTDDLLLRSRTQLLTLRRAGAENRRRAARGRPSRRRRAAPFATAGSSAAGTSLPTARLRFAPARADARRRSASPLHSIVPGFVDAHTHAAYAGDGAASWRQRLAGATYAEIAAAGGGIVSTVAATRDAHPKPESGRRHAPGGSTRCWRAARRPARSRADTA